MKFEDGILAITRKMTGKMLLLEEANSMLEFYDDNELSRQKIKRLHQYCHRYTQTKAVLAMQSEKTI